jgi:four helix bundle protein
MPFDAFDVSVELVRSLAPLVELIGRHDRDLASQIRRAAASAPLNLREGRRRAGRDRQHHWRVAAGSADEIVACLRVAEAWGWVGAADIGASLALADRVLAMCWRMTRP